MQDSQAPAPAGPVIDWQLVQSLYVSGMTPKRIEDKLGVRAGLVSVRANRGKWKDTLAKSNALLKAPIGESSGNKPDSALTRQSERARQGLASTLERFVAKIEQMDPKTAKAALRASGELESVVRNCKAVFGWSEGQSSPVIRIAALAGATVHIGQPSNEPTPIDVQASFSSPAPQQDDGGQPL